MSSALVERYSSLSFQDCLISGKKVHNDEVLGDPTIDLPLQDVNHQQMSFAVPPGIEVYV